MANVSFFGGCSHQDQSVFFFEQSSCVFHTQLTQPCLSFHTALPQAAIDAARQGKPGSSQEASSLRAALNEARAQQADLAAQLQEAERELQVRFDYLLFIFVFVIPRSLQSACFSKRGARTASRPGSTAAGG